MVSVNGIEGRGSWIEGREKFGGSIGKICRMNLRNIMGSAMEKWMKYARSRLRERSEGPIVHGDGVLIKA